MGLWNELRNMKSMLPTNIQIYDNEETGEFAYEIRQPKNPYCPEHVKYYNNSKRGITRFMWGDPERSREPVKEVIKKP